MKIFKLFEGSMSVELPADTEALPAEMVSKLYPYTNRPQIILRSGNMYFTFSLYSKPLNNSEVKAAISAVKETMEKARPACIIEDVKVERYEKRFCGRFSYRLPRSDGAGLGIMYVTAVSGEFMLGTFACNIDDENGRDVFDKLIRSIRCREDTDGN